MFKFVAVSALALALAACGGKEEEVAAEAAPAVEAAPELTAEPTAVPAEGVSAAAAPVEVTPAAE